MHASKLSHPRYGRESFDVGKTGHRYVELATFLAETVTETSVPPAYIFEPKFGERHPELLSHYEVPFMFREDYMEHFATPIFRPYYRWYIHIHHAYTRAYQAHTRTYTLLHT